ncbi:hypothetical protein BN11_2780003 [Nostocoides australiense Ben110]|uniref:Uncharacterized protein n=1 Tax=Nostocoides australiense Ben110 TaxID=1193182 RepID=W6JVI3_9MICO|nr:hypothetical protein BN11_2780003 [Tetrasphaera australiensis Ben110]
MVASRPVRGDNFRRERRLTCTVTLAEGNTRNKNPRIRPFVPTLLPPPSQWGAMLPVTTLRLAWCRRTRTPALSTLNCAAQGATPVW